MHSENYVQLRTVEPLIKAHFMFSNCVQDEDNLLSAIDEYQKFVVDRRTSTFVIVLAIISTEDNVYDDDPYYLRHNQDIAIACTTSTRT